MWGWVALFAVLLVLLAVFPVTRSAVVWIFSAKGPIAIVIAWTWLMVEHVIQAHIVVARNFMPRQMIMPSLEKRRTRID